MREAELNIYETAVLMFGIVPILNILRGAEKREDFEECELIVASINDLNRLVGGTMPTRVEEVEIDKIKSAFDRFGGEMTGENYVRSITRLTREARFYIDEKREELQNSIKQ